VVVGVGETDAPGDGLAGVQAVGEGVGDPVGVAVAEPLAEPDGLAVGDAVGVADAQGPGMPRAAAMARPMLGFSLTMRRIGTAMVYHSTGRCTLSQRLGAVAE